MADEDMTTETTETTTTTETTNTTSTTSTTETTSTTGITQLVLPRSDWHDEDGRIYKDALIENFNAIEAKCNEINALDAFTAPLPDISSLSLEDVDMTADDNKVLNLKSFLEITGLINYPLEIQFAGTKLKKLAYWSSNYRYIVKTNVNTNLTNANKFLIYNTSNETFTAASSVTLNEGDILLACYIEGRAISLISPLTAKLNLMYLLGNMKTDTKTYTTTNDGRDFYFNDGQHAAYSKREMDSSDRANTAYEVGKE